jgi:hypothetical protein
MPILTAMSTESCTEDGDEACGAEGCASGLRRLLAGAGGAAGAAEVCAGDD